MAALIDDFTGGDARLEAGLRAMYEAPDGQPPITGDDADPALRDFMGRAYDTYRQKGKSA
jgi:hypothetical protein